MASSNRTSSKPAAYLDTGRGQVQATSNEMPFGEVIEFAPVAAPMTQARALKSDDEIPTFSLDIDGSTYVYGTQDTMRHAHPDNVQRLSTSDDQQFTDIYHDLMAVSLLHAFSARRGNKRSFTPNIALNVPVDLYNNDRKMDEFRDMVTGKRTFVDYENCQLKLFIDPSNLVILPEGAGAFMYYALDPTTKRNAPTAGVNVVIDVGYETTHVVVFEGTTYQRAQSFTIRRAGMGIVARAVTDWLRRSHRGVEVSQVDEGMHAVAGVSRGAVKKVEIAPNTLVDVAGVYDAECDELAKRIAMEVETRIQGTITRIIPSGGGAFHLANRFEEYMHKYIVVPQKDPNRANVLGLRLYGEIIEGWA